MVIVVVAIFAVCWFPIQVSDWERMSEASLAVTCYPVQRVLSCTNFRRRNL